VLVMHRGRVTADGPRTFRVELAVTVESQAQGLMFRRSLAEDAGMLFVFDPPQAISMWMENTFIPLDMLFIAGDGRIVRIAERTTPLSRERITAGQPVRAVLEINAGTAERFGIREGDLVRHPALGVPEVR